METAEKFIIRVYGLAIHQDRLLVCDEYWFDTPMTKFPGGGLEFGEGTIDCLKRECMEEFGQQVKVLSHFYTTDFFQPTMFLKDKQLISIYYRIEIPDPDVIMVSDVKNIFPEKKDGAMAFRWCSIDKLDSAEFTFPLDRVVFAKLQKRFNVEG